ncbi:hypothetical protein ACXDF8_26805, partial [Mycolicibacterium sp. CBM1]
AAMITVGTDGRPKVAKMEPAVVDGRLLSVGHRHKVRTQRLRRDPRATLFYDAPGPTWLCVETTVEILDTPTTPADIVAFMRLREHRPEGLLAWHGDNGVEIELTETEFEQTMRDEGCVLYLFRIDRTYGNLPD